MSLFKQMKSRQIQKKANDFIKSLSNKSDKEIEQAYLNTKEFENNEIVLSYLFFHHPSLIRILPIDFQKSRLNSNLSMFRQGSIEARRALVSDWLAGNKFFMNSNVLDLDPEEYISYIKLYFSQPDDVAKLYMEDLREVITVLSNSDLKATEDLLNKIKDKLTDKQWEFVIKVNPCFIKYASQNVQNKYAEDERYNMYISGDARNNFVKKQIDKIKNDFTLLHTMPVDVQKEFIKEYPFMINYLDTSTLIELLKYDIELIKYLNIAALKSKDNKDHEVVYGLLEEIGNRNINDIVNILIDKGLLNAKGKLYRFDSKSNNISYQYTKRLIKIIQGLSIEQMMLLINIDVNYVLPYVVPVYKNDTDRKTKESIIIDCDSRCLNLFRAYYDQELYSKFYKVINKIYNEYLENIDKYDFSVDYNCVFDLFKVLFNKNIMTKNNAEKITLFMGISLLYKGKEGKTQESAIKLLSDLLSTAYNKEIKLNTEIYNIYSLEIFDDRLSFISSDLLNNYCKYNFVNMSTLLLIVKSKRNRELFIKYYDIFKSIYGESKESLYKAVENFTYYKEIIADIDGKNLNDVEIDNLIDLIATYGNYLHITRVSELASYDISLLKKLISELSAIKDVSVYKNLLCKYLFNKGYDKNGNSGWLEISTIKELCDVFDAENLENIEDAGNKVFSTEEINLFSMIKLLFNINDADLYLGYIDNLVNNKTNRNLISVIDFFNKLKKYRCEIVNDQIVTIEDIELLYIDSPDIVEKRMEDGVVVYEIDNQDFKILCSYTNDGTHYACMNISDLEKNCYGYDKLVKTGSLRFTTYDDHTLIKVNKDRVDKYTMVPSFIVIVGKLTSDLIAIAKKNNLKVIYIQNN